MRGGYRSLVNISTGEAGPRSGGRLGGIGGWWNFCCGSTLMFIFSFNSPIKLTISAIGFPLLSLAAGGRLEDQVLNPEAARLRVIPSNSFSSAQCRAPVAVRRVAVGEKVSSVNFILRVADSSTGPTA